MKTWTLSESRLLRLEEGSLKKFFHFLVATGFILKILLVMNWLSGLINNNHKLNIEFGFSVLQVEIQGLMKW